MENSILLARFIGPFIILIAISVIFNSKLYTQIMDGFFKNPGLAYITGLITFVAGLAVVLSHNIWVMDWRVIITLFGWSALIKGAWLVISPAVSARITDAFVKNIKLLVIPWIIMLALGIFLTAKGY